MLHSFAGHAQLCCTVWPDLTVKHHFIEYIIEVKCPGTAEKSMLIGLAAKISPQRFTIDQTDGGAIHCHNPVPFPAFDLMLKNTVEVQAQNHIPHIKK